MVDSGNYQVMSPSSYPREDRHWGADLDFLKEAANALLAKSKSKIDYFDIGCGPGFHVVMMGRWYPEISLVGVDISEHMLRAARAEVSRAGLKNIDFIHSDILNLPTERKCNLVSFLNNGLGNMHQEGTSSYVLRVNAIQKIRALMRKYGHAVMSVYNLEKLTPCYGPNHRILPGGDIKSGDLFIEYQPRGSHRIETYYSHWFTENELVELLEQNGFKIDLFEKRMARLVVRARAV